MLGELSYEVLHCAVSSSLSSQKFYKGWRRAPRPASPRSGEREREREKKKKAIDRRVRKTTASQLATQLSSGLCNYKCRPSKPDFLRDDTHRSVPLSRRERVVIEFPLCLLCSDVRFTYLWAPFDSYYRPVKRTEDFVTERGAAAAAPSSRLVEVFVTFKGSQCAAATRKDST